MNSFFFGTSPLCVRAYPSISRYVDNRYPKETDINNILNKYSIDTGSDVVAQGTRSVLAQNQEVGNKEVEGERVILILELYPNGKEIIKIKKGDSYEIIHLDCHHIK